MWNFAKFFKIDSGFYLIVLLSILNFTLFLDSNLVLFFTLFVVFIFLSLFLIRSTKTLIENEKIHQQFLVLDFLNKIKYNLLFLKQTNIKLLNLVDFFRAFLKLKYFNSIMYRCLIIPRTNYFFNFIFSFILFFQYFQRKNLLHTYYIENFFDF